MVSMWEVRAAGRSHRITIEHDPETDRAAVRVDGKAAAKPLSRQEPERQFSAGPQTYSARWLPNGTFDIELLTQDFAPSNASPDLEPRRVPFFRIVILAILLGLLGMLVRPLIKERPAEVTAEWKKYKSPDGWFRVEFPGYPSRTKPTFGAIPGAENAISVSAESAGHVFRVDYAFIPGATATQSTSLVIAEEIKKQIRREGGKTLEERYVLFTGEWAYEVFAEVPVRKGESEMRHARVRILVNQYSKGVRIFFASVDTPVGATTSRAARRFFDSFGLVV